MGASPIPVAHVFTAGLFKLKGQPQGSTRFPLPCKPTASHSPSFWTSYWGRPLWWRSWHTAWTFLGHEALQRVSGLKRPSFQAALAQWPVIATGNWGCGAFEGALGGAGIWLVEPCQDLFEREAV